MNEESKKILEMLSERKISDDETERLLYALEKVETPASPVKKVEKKIVKIMKDRQKPEGEPKFLRIVVDSAKGDEVDIRLPLGLVKAGLKLSAVMPKGTDEKLKEKVIDLTEFTDMNTTELIMALKDLEVNVQSGDGDDVAIYAE
ncbi:MAG: hypothetical protein K8S87_02015 [Planctomycetes bacterium]|nr:hypothetical protein [Planctomycetota bacterium]